MGLFSPPAIRAQYEALLREPTGYCLVFHAPAEIVRYTNQEAEKDTGPATEMVSSGVTLRLP
jgi:hypothetical protein